jgi:hypothetical protein
MRSARHGILEVIATTIPIATTMTTTASRRKRNLSVETQLSCVSTF